MTGPAPTFCGLTATHPADRRQYPSLCFAYLAAYAGRHCPAARVVTAETAGQAVDAAPDLVGVSASSLNIKQAVELAREIKKRRPVPLLLGGVHLSALPQSLPEAFDVGVIGEGEQTFVELLQAWQADGRLLPERLRGIPGLVFRDAGRLVQTPRRPPIADLAEVPPPDRSVLRGDFRRAHVLTSRGCPYRCRFCSSRVFWEKWRPFPVATVLAEIDDLVAHYGTEEIHFFDDLFAVDAARLAAIADGVASRGYPGRVKFSCTVRAEAADEAVFTQLARLGVDRITFGAESQSPRLLQWLKGDGASVEANRRVLELARRFGMRCRPSFIKGVPGETGDDLLATYEFILRSVRERRIDYFEVHTLTPFPGTAVWDLARERGLVDEAMDFDELRVPWERLYLNEAMPKTSFYFFENLNEIATRWLGINRRRIVAVIDVSHGHERLPDLLADLRARGIADETLVVVFHGRTDPATLPAGAGGPELLRPLLEKDDPSLLVVYLQPEEGIDADAVNRLLWAQFDGEADLTFYDAFRHFAPATPFERSLAAGNQRALRAGLLAFTGEPGAAARLAAQGVTTAVYRPDLDPFTPQTAAARLFSEKLRRDFGIERPWKGSGERWRAVEERIVTDAVLLPGREARRRKLKKVGDKLRAARRRMTGDDERD